MSVSGLPRMSPSKDCTCFLRGGVMRSDDLYRSALHKLGVYGKYFVDQQVRPGTIFDNVFAVSSISRYHRRVPRVVYAIAKGGLYLVTVIDLEGGHPQPIALIDEAISCKLLNLW